MQRQISTTTRTIPFLLVDELDNTTGLTGATVTVTVSKPGASVYSASAGSVAERGHGLYEYTPAAGEVDTLGTLLLHATATGAAPADVAVEIVTDDPFDLPTLKDDSITAAKFDESTAFPLKSADTGATQVARTGADGDTLETLSDQADALSATVAATDPLPLDSPKSAGAILETVRGDDHTTDSPHGAYVWSAPAATWGDLTGATITFTSRRASDDEAEINGYTAGFTVLNANTSSQQVQLDLPAAQTALLTPGAHGAKLTNKFDVQVVRSDDVSFTLARGVPPLSGHTIYEDQTRAS